MKWSLQRGFSDLHLGLFLGYRFCFGRSGAEMVSQSAQAAVTKFYRCGGRGEVVQHRNLFLEAERSRARGQHDQVRALFLACGWPPSCCVLTGWGERVLVSSSPYNAPVPSWASILVTSRNLIPLGTQTSSPAFLTSSQEMQRQTAHGPH